MFSRTRTFSYNLGLLSILGISYIYICIYIYIFLIYAVRINIFAVVPVMSFRAFPRPRIQSRSTRCFCRFVSPFMDGGTEAQRGDDLPEVSHMPSKIVALNPNFGCQVVPLSSYYCASCSRRWLGEASGSQSHLQV